MRWKFKAKPNKSILKFVSDRTASPAQTQPPTVGAPQPRTIVYRALKTGKTKLKLQYIGPDRTTVGDSLSITVRSSEARFAGAHCSWRACGGGSCGARVRLVE